MRTAVVGSGPAGLAAARRLHELGVEVVVLEADDGPGGRTRTVDHEGFDLDVGAVFVMGSYDATLEYLAQAGVEQTRWIARAAVRDAAGEMTTVRFDQPWSFLRMPQLTLGDKLRLVRVIAATVLRPGARPFDLDGLAAHDDGETLEHWARRTLGDRVFEYVVRPLMGPLTGADPALISSVFTRALLKQPHRVQLTVPRGGLGAITRSLAAGLDVRYGERVEAISRTSSGLAVSTTSEELLVDSVVLAADVQTTAELLDQLGEAPDAVARLRKVEPVFAHHVAFGYRSDPWPEVEHDLVVHAHEGLHHDFGVLAHRRRAPGSVPAGGQAVSVWFDDRQAPDATPERLVELAREAVARTFGPAEPDVVRVWTWPVTLIAPTPGHYASMQQAIEAMPADVALAGDFLTHSGIEGCLLTGRRAADHLATGQ